jgi:hypothetical protein
MAVRRGKGQRDQTKERRWRRIVRQWRSSGLSVREFCDWQGLSEPSFYAWRRELAKRDQEAAAAVPGVTAAGGSRPVKEKDAPRMPPPAFVPVRVVVDGAPLDSAAPSRTDRLEVHLPGGVRLSVHSGCDRELLQDVIACCAGMAPGSPPC